MGLSRWDGGSGRNFGCPATRAIEPVQDVDVRVKKRVAPSKRSHRCFFGIVRSDPHGGQNSLLWLTSSCERGREAGISSSGTDLIALLEKSGENGPFAFTDLPRGVVQPSSRKTILHKGCS
jgi:hypothetical protein